MRNIRGRLSKLEGGDKRIHLFCGTGKEIAKEQELIEREPGHGVVYTFVITGVPSSDGDD